MKEVWVNTVALNALVLIVTFTLVVWWKIRHKQSNSKVTNCLPRNEYHNWWCFEPGGSKASGGMVCIHSDMYNDGPVQDCSISIANDLEIPVFDKSSIYWGATLHSAYSISWEMCTKVVLCSVLLWLSYGRSLTFFRVTSQALGQSYDCPSASEATLKDIGICLAWIQGTLLLTWINFNTSMDK